MRRSIALLMSMILLLCSCGGRAENTPASTSLAQSESQNVVSNELSQAPGESSQPAENPDADFRNVSWGMTEEEVITYEKETNVQKPSTGGLVYPNLTVSGKSAHLAYSFNENNQLYMAGYVFQIDHVNDTLYIDDFNDLKESLTSLYGPPTDYQEAWYNDLFKGETQDYGTAIAAGHLAYFAKWELDNTDILLGLTGDNFTISLILSYTSTTVPEPQSDLSGL